MQQNSPEWFAARLGRVTASRVADVVAKTKTGWGASRAAYMGTLVAERLTGVPFPTYENEAMKLGREREPEARNLYAFIHGVEVEEVGFIQHPTIAMSGASPDGQVGKKGLVEIKCPKTHTHIATLLGGSIDKVYDLQMQWQMACTDRLWVDFVSYDPMMPENMRLHVQRVNRSESTIDMLEKEVIVFLDELNDQIAQLKFKFGERDAA
jgi:putative phage-type endonuclease